MALTNLYNNRKETCLNLTNDHEDYAQYHVECCQDVRHWLYA
jgi:hypothetical protein